MAGETFEQIAMDPKKDVFASRMATGGRALAPGWRPWLAGNPKEVPCQFRWVPEFRRVVRNLSLVLTPDDRGFAHCSGVPTDPRIWNNTGKVDLRVYALQKTWHLRTLEDHSIQQFFFFLVLGRLPQGRPFKLNKLFLVGVSWTPNCGSLLASV